MQVPVLLVMILAKTFPFGTVGLVLLFCFILSMAIKRAKHKESQDSQSFWDKETKANSSRKKDISGLEYLKVPVDSLPFGLCPSFSELEANEANIRKLAERKLFSLGNRTNTQVKLEFGVGNFDFLSECDAAYQQLLRCLSKEAELLMSLSFTKEAVQVLNYSLSIGDDIPKDYITLANIYKSESDRKSLAKLIARAEQIDSLTKKKLIEDLEKIEASF